MSAGPSAEEAIEGDVTAVTRELPRRSTRDQVVVLPSVGWEGYTQMLRLRGERRRPRIFYLDGNVYLMSPGHSHEKDRERITLFISEVVVGCRIPCIFAGSTTYRRRKKRGGVEPDQSYYLANVPRVSNKKTIDLRIDPPPDLAVEVVYSHAAHAALEVSRRLGVPEVWVCTEKGLTFRILGPNGRYAISPTSLAFPFLTPGEIFDWIRRPEPEGTSTTDWIIDVRRWVDETHVPRIRNAQA